MLEFTAVSDRKYLIELDPDSQRGCIKPICELGYPPKKPDYVRVVCVSDTHLNYRNMPDGDIFIHTGGFCGSGGNQSYDFADYINKLPHEHKVIALSEKDGHFATSVLRRCTTAIVLNSPHGATTMLKGIKIHAASYVRSEIFGSEYYNYAVPVEPVASWDIVMSSIPPRGIHDKNLLGSHIGSADFARYMRNHPPRACVFGGAATDGGASFIGQTLFANVGQWDKNTRYGTPVIIDIKPVFYSK